MFKMNEKNFENKAWILYFIDTEVLENSETRHSMMRSTVHAMFTAQGTCKATTGLLTLSKAGALNSPTT